MIPSSRYRKPQLREGIARKIRKSVSCEPILDFSSSDDEERTGGAFFSPRILVASMFPLLCFYKFSCLLFKDIVSQVFKL